MRETIKLLIENDISSLIPDMVLMQRDNEMIVDLGQLEPTYQQFIAGDLDCSPTIIRAMKLYSKYRQL